MPLKVLTRENIEELSKESGHSVEKLWALLKTATAAREPAWVRVPFPKHLR